MKRTLLALLIVTLIVAGSAFGVAYWLRCRSCATTKVDWVKELHLTGDQAAAFAKLETEFEKKLAACCADHCAARAALAESLTNAGKATESCRQMCAAQTASEQAALEHIFQVRALLTPEQQQRHIELVRQQLTGACPMRLHKP
jgi:Spy/CpxP family protein refolding chaperone